MSRMARLSWFPRMAASGASGWWVVGMSRPLLRLTRIGVMATYRNEGFRNGARIPDLTAVNHQAPLRSTVTQLRSTDLTKETWAQQKTPWVRRPEGSRLSKVTQMVRSLPDDLYAGRIKCPGPPPGRQDADGHQRRNDLPARG